MTRKLSMARSHTASVSSCESPQRCVLFRIHPARVIQLNTSTWAMYRVPCPRAQVGPAVRACTWFIRRKTKFPLASRIHLPDGVTIAVSAPRGDLSGSEVDMGVLRSAEINDSNLTRHATAQSVVWKALLPGALLLIMHGSHLHLAFCDDAWSVLLHGHS